MKTTWIVMAFVCMAQAAVAQDSSYRPPADTATEAAKTQSRNEPDTIRVGNFVIVKESREGQNGEDKGKSFTVVIRTRKHGNDTLAPTEKSAFSTNWFIFDVGFANIYDETNYAAAAGSPYLQVNANESSFGKSDFKLLTKSSNINVWLFMQKLNMAKEALNLKYGLGLEMFNYRYDNNISYHKTPSYVFRDSVNFSKNKLYTSYISIPLMLNVNPWPDKKIISFSVGASAGYLVGSHTKQISDERGKDKVRGDFDLNKWRLAYIGELAIGPVRLYGSYSMKPLHDNTLKQYPYTLGVRLSNW